MLLVKVVGTRYEEGHVFETAGGMHTDAETGEVPDEFNMTPRFE